MSPAPILHIDVESASAAPLLRGGVEIYWAHESTHLLCMRYAFDAGPNRTWMPGEPCPPGIAAHIAAKYPSSITSHNAHFEMGAGRYLNERHGWPLIEEWQFFDTMAQARACGLPGGLEDCANAMNLPIKKGHEGRALIQFLSVPDKSGNFRKDPERLARMVAYCGDDVEVQRLIYDRLPKLDAIEQAMWALDARINVRGVAVDVASVKKLLEIVAIITAESKSRIRTLTGGAVRAATEVQRLRDFLLCEGVELPDLKGSTIADALKPGAPGTELAKLLLEMRKEASKASTSKLKAMLVSSTVDGRARGLLSFYGADTGRWAGRRIQTQNMPRTPKGFDASTVLDCLDMEPADAAEYLGAVYGSKLEPISWALRSLICAAPGNDLMAVDYSNIEGRVLAWQAGEEWKLDAFRDYDAGTGPDLYKLAYANSFRVPVEQIGDDQRQIGKVQELALGYAGGKGAFATMAAAFGIVVIPDGQNERPDAAMILTHSEVDTIKNGWRTAHPATVKYWATQYAAALNAVQQPGRKFESGPCVFKQSGPFLLCQLPSGRLLRYPYPSITKAPSYSFRLKCEDFADDVIAVSPVGPVSEAAYNLKSVAPRGDLPWLQKALGRVAGLATGDHKARAFELIDAAPASLQDQLQCHGRGKKTYSAKGKPQRAKWGPWYPYGGLLVENTTQAIARDILRDGLLRLEANGYSTVMHVHDEIVTEQLPTFGSVAEMAAIMCELPEWANGLPLTATGWRGPRYRK